MVGDHAGRRFMQKEHAAGRTRPACAGHPTRARADRTADCACTGSMLPGSGKTFINLVLAYSAKDRRIARFAGLVAGISIVAINSAIIAVTGGRPR